VSGVIRRWYALWPGGEAPFRIPSDSDTFIVYFRIIAREILIPDRWPGGIEIRIRD
jgi:hypothetical protein